MNLEQPVLNWPPQYTIKRHRLARNVRLRASALRGLVIIVPFRFNLRELPMILEEHKSWIQKQLVITIHQAVETLPNHIEIGAFAETWSVIYVKTHAKLKLVQRPHLQEVVLIGDISDQRLCKEKLLAWIKKQAKIRLPVLLEQVSQMMRLSYTKVTIRAQHTLWGSCTIDKSINLNFKLLFLPKRLAMHIMVHELSHTIHLDHSDKFWQLVAKHDSAWKEHRRELKAAEKYIPSFAS